MIEKEIKDKSKLSFVTISLICLRLFLLIAQIASAIYTACGVEPSLIFSLLDAFGLLWIISWRLEDDNKQYKIKSVYDFGLFLYLAWFIVIPYYLREG